MQDADGHDVGLADFRGKVVVLHFIYTNCPDECPLHAERIAEIQGLINQSPMRQQVEFISITTDPSRDKGDVLRNYGHAHGLDPANWIFLTTKPDQPEDTTRALAERFRHRFDKTEDGYQIHGIVTHVIDKEGHWRANFHGLQFEGFPARPRSRTRLQVPLRLRRSKCVLTRTWPPTCRGASPRRIWSKSASASSVRSLSPPSI